MGTENSRKFYGNFTEIYWNRKRFWIVYDFSEIPVKFQQKISVQNFRSNPGDDDSDIIINSYNYTQSHDSHTRQAA